MTASPAKFITRKPADVSTESWIRAGKIPPPVGAASAPGGLAARAALPGRGCVGGGQFPAPVRRGGRSGLAGLARLLQPLEGRERPVGLRLPAEPRVGDEELVVHARVGPAQGGAALEQRQRLAVALETHEQPPEV